MKWDPHQPNNLFLKQSAFLYSSYYSTQINIHRAFIPSPRKPSCVSFPSLAICTNAARSCIHVLDVQYRLCGGSYLNLVSALPSEASTASRGCAGFSILREHRALAEHMGRQARGSLH